MSSVWHRSPRIRHDKGERTNNTGRTAATNEQDWVLTGPPTNDDIKKYGQTDRSIEQYLPDLRFINQSNTESDG